jgi:hypothetical protein
MATASRETRLLVDQAARRADGGILMITDTHTWSGLPDYGQQLLRRIYQELTQSRALIRDDLAVILAGRPVPAVIDFPGYTAAQLAAIFATLAGEAGFTLTPDAAAQAATVLAGAEDRHVRRNARLCRSCPESRGAGQS